MGKTVFQSMEQNRHYYYRDCFATKQFFLETLIEEMNPIFMGNKRGWVCMSGKTIGGAFFGNFSLSGRSINDQNE